MYNEGDLIDRARCSIWHLKKQIIEKKRGSWLNYRGTQLAQGRDAAEGRV